MDNKIKVFHIDDEYFHINKRGDRYTGYEEYWGNWVTNKATRTTEKYATYYRADGTVGHTMSEKDAKRLWNACRNQNIEHIYPVSDREVAQMLKRLRCVTERQRLCFAEALGLSLSSKEPIEGICCMTGYDLARYIEENVYEPIFMDATVAMADRAARYHGCYSKVKVAARPDDVFIISRER